jgi:fibronectin-binding autotransporter adhesin
MKPKSTARLSFPLACAIAALLAAPVAHAISLTWDADGLPPGPTDGPGVWLNPGLWWDGAANATWSNATPDDAIIGNAGVGGVVTLGAVTAGSLTFNGFTGTYALSGGTLVLNSGLTQNVGAGTVAISSPVTLGGSQSWTNNATSTLTLSGGVTGTGNLILNNNSATASGITLSTAAVNPAGTITNSGTGSGTTLISAVVGTSVTGVVQNSATSALTLSGTNTYTGATTVSAGRLQFNSAGAIGGSGRSVTVSAGATVSAGIGFTITNAFLNRLEENSNAFNVNHSTSGSTTTSSALDFSSNTGANLPNAVLTATPPGGNVSTIYNGVLTPGSNGYRFGNLNTTNTFDNGTIFTVASVLTGPNNVVISGISPVYLTGANPNYTGGTIVNPGAVLGFDTTNVTGLAAGSIQVGAGSIIMRRGGNLDAAFLSLLAPTNNAFGLIGNNGSSGANLDLTNYPNASLTLWDRAGTQTFAFTGTITPGNNTYRFGTTRTGSNINLTVANTLTGARDVVVNGGNLRLAAAMDYTGTTTINAGTFTIGSPVAGFPTNGNGRIGGGIYAANILNNGTLAHTSSLDQTLSGVISGTGAVTKSFTTSSGGNAGTWGTNSTLTLSGANTYTGLTSALAGTISFNSIADVSGGSSALGAPVTTAAGTIAIGTTTNAGGLLYTGSGHTSNRVINLAGTTGGATINASGSGALVLTSSLTATGAGIKNLTLTGSNTADNRIGGAIVNNSVTNITSLAKSGAGTWVLSGTNTYSGGTTISGGTLKLDHTIDSSRLSDTGILSLAGGTLDLAGGSHTEIVASTTLAAGALFSVTRSSGSATLALNTITPGSAAQINFAAGNIATTDNPNTNGIVGTWATVGGTDWAANSTGLADGDIVAYTGYTDIDAQGSTIVDNATSNVRILGNGSGGNIELGAAATTIYTLLQSNAAIDATLNTAGKTLSAGAIWIGAGKAALTIGAAAGDGTLTAATAGGNLALINDNPAKNLTVNAVVADNTSASTLSTAGPGTVVLNGSNTHSGGTTLGGGTLVLGNGAALGGGTFTIAGGALASTGTIVIPNAINANGDFSITGSGTLTLTGAMLLSANRVITNGNTTGITTLGDISGTNRTLTFSGDGDTAAGGIIAIGTGGLVKNGVGTLTLINSSTYTGATTINSGTLQIGNGGNTGSIAGTSPVTNNASLVFNLSNDPNPDLTVANVISGSGTLTKQGNGRVILTGNSSYTGATTITTGTLQVGNGGTTGSITGPAGITNNAALVFARSNALTVGQVVSGSGTLTQGGTGTLTLAGTNTYTGDTILTTGTLSAAVTANLGDPTSDLVFNGGALQVTGTALTSFSGIGHTVTFTPDLAVALDVNDPLNTFTVDQVLNQGLGGFTKRGAGTAILNQVNTYTGDTIISAGTLLVNSPGSLSAGTLVYVDAGTLGGNGTIGGSVNVLGPANLAPGTSAGTLSIGGGLDLSAQGAGAGKLAFELSSLAGTSDKIAVTGSLTIGSSLGFNNFTFTNLGGLEVGTYKLITSAGVIGALDPANLGGRMGAFNGTLQISVDSKDLEVVVTPASPFEIWMSGFSVGALTGLNDDPDLDGVPNFLEFALNSNPASGSSQGKAFGRLATVGGIPGVLTYTIAARSGAAFTANGNNQQAVVAADSLTYLIEAANDLSDWGTPLVEEVTGPDAAAIQATLTPPAPEAGWTYYTFRTDGSAASDPKDFIRAEVTSP